MELIPIIIYVFTLMLITLVFRRSYKILKITYDENLDTLMNQYKSKIKHKDKRINCLTSRLARRDKRITNLLLKKQEKWANK